MKNIKTRLVNSYIKSFALCLTLSAVIQTAHSQLLTTDNVSINIAAATQLTVQGDIQNQNGAAISNNGTIDLSGNWIHNAANNCFGTSSGTVILNGVSQTIGGSNSTLFNNLTLQGTGNKTLMINTSVGGSAASGILHIGTRNLILNSKSLTINNPTGGAIFFKTGIITSEQTDNTSKVIWNINAVAGAHIIPFGNASGVQLPLTYNLTSGNAGALTASTYPTNAANVPLPVTPTLVTHIRNSLGLDNSANTVDRFWQVDVSGTPTADLTFTWATTENAANGNTNPQAQRWSAPTVAWNAPLPGQTTGAGGQSVTVPNVTAYGPWAVALSLSPLPIQLLSFDAKSNENETVLCKWSTANEINNDFFTVERSTDANNFEGIGIVDGAGNSNSILNYSLTDKHPYKGISYYRLKQTDFNGNFSYSNIVAVKINNEAGFDVSVFPNPAQNNLNIEFNSESKSDAAICLYDVSGRKVLSENYSADNEIKTKKIDISYLSKGIYFVEVISGSNKKTIKVVKD